jgi:hypothetical protein
MVTEAVVSRMKVASQKFTNLHKLSEGDLQEILQIPEPAVIKRTLLHEDANSAREHIPHIKAELRKLPNYPAHRRTVEEFFRVVQAGYCPGPNLLRNWR